MFRKLLVPTDFSSGAQPALDHALEFARSEGAYVELLHVVSPQLAADTMLAMDLVTPAVVQARQALARIVSELECADHIVLSYAVQVGTPWRVIVERSKGFDVIFMGTQGRSGLSKLILGSVAQRVVQHAPCPVMTVRQTDNEAEQTAGEVVHAMFENVEGAERGLASLTDAGISLEDVSVVVRDDTHADDVEALDHTKALEGTTAGGLIGGSLGGILGGMAGMGSIVSGGLGLMVMGPALALGAVGGLVGGLLGHSVLSDRAKVLRAELDAGSVLVAVHLRGDDDGHAVRAALMKNGGDILDLD